MLHHRKFLPKETEEILAISLNQSTLRIIRKAKPKALLIQNPLHQKTYLILPKQNQAAHPARIRRILPAVCANRQNIKFFGNKENLHTDASFGESFQYP
ncbi:MAG: hypothetical protein DU481_15315 [Nitrosomonas sp.]